MRSCLARHSSHRLRFVSSMSAIAVIVAASSCGGSPDAVETVPTSTTQPSTQAPGSVPPSATATVPNVTELPAPKPPTVEQVRFTSGDFELAGELTLPASTGPHPAVIVVHGSGPQTRSSTPGTDVVLDRFGAESFAVLTWDKPGSGESTGEFDPERTLRQRAAILADGVRLLIERPDIDPGRIGFWGLSQAGWVMPLALELVDDVAFMVVVSGGGEDSIEQLSYQLGRQVVCEGRTPEQGELVEANFPLVAKGPSYDDYLAAMEVLVEIEGWEKFAGPDMRSEDEWQPWPSEIDAYFDPITVIEHTTIPVLAVFGEMDRFVDPIQGAAAYEQALELAGNTQFRVELISGMSHTMQNQQTMCGTGSGTASEYLDVLDRWLASLTAIWNATS